MARAVVKTEPGTAAESSGEPSGTHGGAVRRSLRSSYLAVKNLISGEDLRLFLTFVLSISVCCVFNLSLFVDDKDHPGCADSDKFASIFTHVENLHELGE